MKEIFEKKVHFWGRFSIVLTLIASFLIPFYLTFVLGFYPDLNDIIAGFIAILGFVGVIWVVEPISYYLILGSAGTYISFVTGNIANMKIPAVSATLDALNLKSGSLEGQIAGIFALIASTLTNLIILSIVIVAGSFLIANLPKSVLDAFRFALPGILGAMIVILGSKIDKKNMFFVLALTIFIIAFIKFSPLFLNEKLAISLAVGNSGIVAIFVIFYAIITSKKERSK